MKKIVADEVVNWAKQFLLLADKALTREELKEQQKYASLIQNPLNKTLLSKMLDESSQIRDTKLLAYRLKYLIDQFGVPTFFTTFEKFQLSLFTSFGYLFDPIAIPIFKNKLQADTRKIIIPEERPALTTHLSKRWEEQIGQNVNLLGEVVLGDQEAANRFSQYMEALEEPDINYISVKLSGIYAQIRPLSYEKSKEELCQLVASIFRQAMKNTYPDHEGIARAKFVNLDMEEYKDAELTFDVFTTVLAQDEFLSYRAGIVIQAYLPDALLFYRRLLEFAKSRCARGGVPLKFRLVKGANLQMEGIISSLKGWPTPVLPSKVDVDTNHLRVLDEALLPDNAKVLNIGVATHNFFSIGYAYLLSKQNQVTEHVTFEMLEGMANHLPRVMRQLKQQIILYTPVVRKENFLNAVSYLVRRLDENTGPDNFLSYSFELQVDTQAWDFLENQFRLAYAAKDHVEPIVFRQQDRSKPAESLLITEFQNEPDTDLDLPQNREWALNLLKTWERVQEKNLHVPVQIGSQQLKNEQQHTYYDRSKDNQSVVYQASLSSSEQVEQAIQIALKDESKWGETSLESRKSMLYQVALQLANARGSLIGCMAAVTGKVFSEGDVEVSEAIDFCRFYPSSLENFESLNTVHIKPKGVVLVISPWNFPLAIPAGGVASALAAGNRVLLKPATSALPVAWQFAQCFWDAGIPKDAFQIVCPAEYASLDRLTSHPGIAHITLTGGTDTALHLLRNAPRKALSAETGGKNCMIVTASADQDHAIQSVVSSAFSNSGQKCSACSLLLLDKRTYEDEKFKEKLKDAVNSIPVGSVWNPQTVIGPMITNKNTKLLQAMEDLEQGESWLVEPEFVDKANYILRPCVKWGVKPGSYTFTTELFAPLLGVVCIESLEHGVSIANSSKYGLTAGLQSLDEREINYWKARIEAGNLYINRGITGAIVNRQPFGGIKLSAFGGGAKAGGPNYALQFTQIEEAAVEQDVKWQSMFSTYLLDERERRRLNFAFDTYKSAWKTIFSKEVDSNQLVGESNTFRYLPLKRLVVRINATTALVDLLLILQALAVLDSKAVLSIDTNTTLIDKIKEICLEERLPHQVLIEDEDSFICSIDGYDRIRYSSQKVSDAVYLQAGKIGVHLVTTRPIVEGRIELLSYLQEQSISYEYHRYGSILSDLKVSRSN